MEPTVEKIILVDDARFDSPKSMYLGRVMGNLPLSAEYVFFFISCQYCQLLN